MIVLDTNVISELMRPLPSQIVVNWVNAQASGHVWISAITVLEIEFGLELIDDGARRLRLRRAFDQMIGQDLEGHVLAFDSAAASRTAALSAMARKQGRSMELCDAMIAGVVIQHRAQLATRNIRHFADCGIDLINPWLE